MANEAGQGASDRGTNLSGYTIFSNATASQSGDCTRLAVYAELTGTQDIQFAFFSKDGSEFTQETAGYNFTASGSAVQEFTSSGGDFTAFSVTAGWYLGCYVQGAQTYTTSGGVGFFYRSGDHIADITDVVSPNPSDSGTSSGLDGVEADIGSGGTTYNEAVAESITLAETQTDTLTMPVAIAESVGLTDAQSGTYVFPISISEGIGLSDVQSLVQIMDIAIAESIGLSESQSIGANIFDVSISEGIGLSDTQGGTFTLVMQVAEGIGLSDVQSAIGTFAVAISEGMGLTDTYTSGDLAVGKVCVTITSKSASITVEGTASTITITGKAPGIDITGEGC